MSEHAFNCPYCGSSDVRRSHKQGLNELPMMLFGNYPVRCLSCEERFFGNIWMLSTRGYAKCPKCLRLKVRPWAKSEKRMSGWDRLRMAWGAHSYRCVPCRCTFVSFRPCIADAVVEGEAQAIADVTGESESR